MYTYIECKTTLINYNHPLFIQESHTLECQDSGLEGGAVLRWEVRSVDSTF